MSNIYVASSWRNLSQEYYVEFFRKLGHEVYDFKNPPNKSGFSWSEIDPGWRNWRALDYIEKLNHPRAIEGFNSDMDALKNCTHCILILPCGRSAHLELGWAVGAGKRTAIVTKDGQEPELMAKMVDLITYSTKDLKEWADK